MIVMTRKSNSIDWWRVGIRFKPDWEKAAEVAGDQLEAKVVDLKEKGEYQFRIVAVNKAGPSPASDPTKMHLVKYKNRKQTFF